MNKIPVLEIFGPTIQGEGMVIGEKTMFIRTAGCDYACAWCDSAFTWNGTAKDDIRQMTADEIWKELKEIGGEGFSHVTISGGNPALLKNLSEVVELLKEKGMRLAVETQGTRWQDWFLNIDDITVSPKPPSSKMTTNYALLDNIFANLEKSGRLSHVNLKVVVFDDEDYAFAKSIHKRYPQLQIILQVGNSDISLQDREQLLAILLEKYEWLINKVMDDAELKRVKVLPQLHTFVWGNKRGV
jgi:7-carboxy-7-deazaguanine synthase